MTKAKLTKAQYEALKKWRQGPAHHKAVNVREDVYRRLFDHGYLEARGFFVVGLSYGGEEALSNYEGNK